MRELYEILLKKSRGRGYLDFDAPEAEIILDESGTPVDIIKRERGIAERMIEQFMLTANEAVATYLHEREIPCVYVGDIPRNFPCHHVRGNAVFFRPFIKSFFKICALSIVLQRIPAPV